MSHEYVFIHMKEHFGRAEEEYWDRDNFEEQYGVWPTIVPGILLRPIDREVDVVFWSVPPASGLEIHFL